MIPPPVPHDEDARLAALRAFEILDTTPEAALDGLTRLASEICGTPIALITLVDKERQWFKSRVGFQQQETLRRYSFCAHAITQEGIMVVADTEGDERFAGNPLVTGDPGIRFYAGAPLRAGDGHAVGTICVIDRVPRRLVPNQLAALRTLSEAVVAHLEVRRVLRELLRTQNELRTLRAARTTLAGMRDAEKSAGPPRSRARRRAGAGKSRPRKDRRPRANTRQKRAARKA